MVKVGRDRIRIEDENGEILDDLRVQKAKRRDGKTEYEIYYVFTPEGRKKNLGNSDDKPAAIFAYRQWKSAQAGETVSVIVHPGGPPRVNGKALKERDGVFILPDEDRGPLITVDCSDHAKRKTVTIPANAQWEFIRDRILSDPHHAAKMTGIRDLERLQTLPIPQKVSLDKAGNRYCDDWRGKPTIATTYRKWWSEFSRAVDATYIHELTDDDFRAYRRLVEKQQKAANSTSSTFIRNRVHTIKTILNYAFDVLDIDPSVAARLKKSWRGKTRGDPRLKAPPKPRSKALDFEPEEWTAIVAASNTFDACMWHVMLNCAYYPIDIERVEWSHFTTDMKYLRYAREKVDANDTEGTVRVAVLWPETIRLLKAVKKMNLHDRFVFVADANATKGIHGNTLRKHFIAVKKSAGIERDLKPNHLRDSALTIASKKTNRTQYRVLAGKLLGDADDEYIYKNPDYVADACKAIRDHYVTVKPKKKRSKK